MSNLKEWAHGIERNSHQNKIKSLETHKSEEYHKDINNYTQLETNPYNEKDYKENMDSLKNVLIN